jgi:hypothetical protein
MSLGTDGVWKAGVWATTVWAAGVWREGAAEESTDDTRLLNPMAVSPGKMMNRR